MTTLLAFLGAVLGGLILNLMPCVFPILSLKALGLARTGTSPAAARREALAYTAGVVTVCLALGAALIALRASGAAFGWAFQLQNPVVVGALAVLFAALAFNLAGLYELPTPAFAGRAGHVGAFATGALAAFVATPCSGPFMGAALGAAIMLRAPRPAPQPWPLDGLAAPHPRPADVPHRARAPVGARATDRRRRDGAGSRGYTDSDTGAAVDRETSGRVAREWL